MRQGHERAQKASSRRAGRPLTVLSVMDERGKTRVGRDGRGMHGMRGGEEGGSNERGEGKGQKRQWKRKGIH